MNLKNIFITALLSLLTLSLHAQGRVVRGIVVDQKGAPLSNVDVSINEDSGLVRTNNSGEFQFGTRNASVMSFEAEGYEPLVLTEKELLHLDYIVTLLPSLDSGINEMVYLPYRDKKVERQNITSSIYSIDIEKERERDANWSPYSALSNKVTGSMWAGNIRNYGSATYVIDGIVQDDMGSLTMQEIENITVLKDGSARILYGSKADAGVILVTTKRGERNKRDLRFEVETGVSKAIAYPEFVDAATNMQLYNMAHGNDGSTLAVYTDDVIQNSRNGVDDVLYPDVDYYGDTFVKNYSNFTSVYGEASGGDDNTNYYMNVGWYNNSGWLNVCDNSTDSFDVTGKISSKVFDWMTFYTDVKVSYDITKSANTDYSYWDIANTTRPFQQALFIPIDRIEDSTTYSASSIIDGKYILGGSSIYQTNAYGEFSRTGDQVSTTRMLNSNFGLAFEFNKWVTGLTANIYGGFSYMNAFAKVLDNAYAVYSVSQGIGDNLIVNRVNQDLITSEYDVDSSALDFYRNMAGYANLNYDRTFGKHEISAVAMMSVSERIYNAEYQTDKSANVGSQISYGYDDRYMVEAAGTFVGSAKLSSDNQIGFSSSVGGAWVASNEDFWPRDIVPYFKLRGNYTNMVNDNWTDGDYSGYMLYKALYESQGQFLYSFDGLRENKTYEIVSAVSDIFFQRRKELSLGFDAYLFGKSTWIEATYFSSLSYDNITDVSSITPLTLGDLPKYENYNSDLNQGIEIGIRHSFRAADWRFNIGANYLYTNTVNKDVAEFGYDSDYDKHLSKIGTGTSSIWGYQADGLYMPDDFDASGNLINPQYENSFGNVQAGDIRYIDYNNDGVLNSDDMTVIGSYLNNQIANISIEVGYKNWSLYAVCAGQFGGQSVKSSDYYRFTGNVANYSVEALKSYDPNNPSADAMYPRLSLGSSTNNYQTSSFWLVDTSAITIPTLQLSYDVKLESSVLSSLKCYIRGTNLLTIAKNKDYLTLNYGGDPNSSGFIVGIATRF